MFDFWIVLIKMKEIMNQQELEDRLILVLSLNNK